MTCGLRLRSRSSPQTRRLSSGCPFGGNTHYGWNASAVQTAREDHEYGHVGPDRYLAGGRFRPAGDPPSAPRPRGETEGAPRLADAGLRSPGSDRPLDPPRGTRHARHRAPLRQVTLVQNDAGIAQLLVGVHDERIARLVLASCEALDNYPPGFQGKALHAARQDPRRAPPAPAELPLSLPRRDADLPGRHGRTADPARAGAALVRPAARRPGDPAGSHRVPARHPQGHLPPGRRAAAHLRPPRPRRLGRPGPDDAALDRTAGSPNSCHGANTWRSRTPAP